MHVPQLQPQKHLDIQLKPDVALKRRRETPSFEMYVHVCAVDQETIATAVELS